MFDQNDSIAVLNLDPLASGEARLQGRIPQALCVWYLDPLASGEARRGCRSPRYLRCDLDPLASGEARLTEAELELADGWI